MDGTTFTGAGIVLGGANASDNPPQECYSCIAWANIVRVPATTKALDFQGSLDGLFANNIVVSGEFGMDIAPSSSNINNRFLNNISSCGRSAATADLNGSYTFDYNLFFNCTGAPSQTHAITGDPLFVNATNLADLRLRAGSPARFTGTVWGACSDYLGHVCNTPSPDIGAYQVTSGSPATTRQ